MTDTDSKGRPGGSRGGLHTSAQSQTRESHPAENDLAENSPAEKEEQMQRGLLKRDIESELG